MLYIKIDMSPNGYYTSGGSRVFYLYGSSDPGHLSVNNPRGEYGVRPEFLLVMESS